MLNGVPLVGGVIPVRGDRAASRVMHQSLRRGRPTWKLPGRRVRTLQVSRPAPQQGGDINPQPVEGLGVDPASTAPQPPGWLQTIVGVGQNALQLMQARDDRKAEERAAANARAAADLAARQSQLEQTQIAQDRGLVEKLAEASTKRTLIIGGVVAGVAALGIIAYMATRKSK